MILKTARRFIKHLNQKGYHAYQRRTARSILHQIESKEGRTDPKLVAKAN
ncbi:MAG: hypothetical protein KTR24_06640 [Saprospiraceae bacterium]|nr:hypothetical protein [Saprospiraceae bacterium]